MDKWSELPIGEVTMALDDGIQIGTKTRSIVEGEPVLEK